MTKRTFVLFYCLVSLLALFGSFSGKAAIVNIEYNIFGFNSAGEEICDGQENEYLFGTTYDSNQAVFVEDIFEWKENLNYLLRLRNSSFRFPASEYSGTTNFKFSYSQLSFRLSSAIISSKIRAVTLSAYYLFLHRLCPF